MDVHSRWGRGTRIHDADLGKTTLLNAALGCLAEKGFRATTMQDVAEAASVSRRTVYRYFSGKDEMLREVATHSEAMAFQAMQRTAERYHDDFFTFFGEAVVAGADYYLKMDTETKAAVSANLPAIQAHIDHDMVVTRWKRLLRGPYQRYLGQNPDARESGMLDKYAELATLLVAGHCQLRSPECNVRESFQNMMALSARGRTRVQQRQRKAPAGY